MRADLLLRGADLLEQDADNPEGITFDLSSWGTIRDDGKPYSCRTSGCAMGLFAVSGAFEHEGLSFCANNQWTTSIQFLFKGVEVSPAEAAETLFQLESKDVILLFAANIQDADGNNVYCRGPGIERLVAKRIRDFVAAKSSKG